MVSNNTLLLIRNGVFTPCDTMTLQEIAGELLAAREKLAENAQGALVRLQILAEQMGVPVEQVSTEQHSTSTRLILNDENGYLISRYWTFEPDAWENIARDLAYEGHRQGRKTT